MSLRLTVYLIILVASQAIANDDPDIRQLMTKQEFEEAGLQHLSEQQIDALNRWLVRYTAHDAPEVASKSTAVKESVKDGFTSHIDGEFTGWNGKTLLRLKNGQVWQPRYNRRYRYSAVDPEVEISKNALGFYTLTVVETGQSIGVKRIK